MIDEGLEKWLNNLDENYEHEAKKDLSGQIFHIVRPTEHVQSLPVTLMGIKWISLVSWVLKLQKEKFFYNVSLWGKVFLGPRTSRDVVVTLFDHYVRSESKPSAVPEGLL